nr:MAG TPA: hypothetical protein [Bacteriophage sp.]
MKIPELGKLWKFKIYLYIFLSGVYCYTSLFNTY